MQGMLLPTDKHRRKRRELNQIFLQGDLFETVAGALSYKRLHKRDKIRHKPRSHSPRMR